MKKSNFTESQIVKAIKVDIPTKVHQCSALKYSIYSGAKYASQTGQYHH
jgi:hypothetical protein